MSKFEWKKQLKELYLPSTQPTIIDVPTMKFFTIDGKGNPNEKPFQEHIEILYALSYAIRMMPKRGLRRKGIMNIPCFHWKGIGIWMKKEERKIIWIKTTSCIN